MTLLDELKKRLLVLDGGMGTLLQRMLANQSEEDCVRQIHQAYIDAGADIISTHTFTANEGSDIRGRNLKYGRLARSVADMAPRKVFVVGSTGPTNHTLSLANDSSFDSLCNNYQWQFEALAESGVDALLLETFFDTLNLKAALVAASKAAPQLPVMVSVTLEKSGRLLSGQTLEAFLATVEPFHPLSVGLNCSFGAADLLPFAQQLAQKASCYISVHPNAGLPDESGNYAESPETMFEAMQPYFEQQLLNIVGGCCGTTPEHIRLLSAQAAMCRPHRVNTYQAPFLAGLEPLDSQNFIQIGERTNVAGSRKFAKLIAAQDFETALVVARKQVEGGARVIDICMDDAMLDATACMCKFLRLAGADPYIARVPFMIDSSNWNVLEEGLKYIQGKVLVNSISLKEGEEVFLQRAAYIRQMGAAVVVMAFDEQGQATTYERRCQVCERAYRLLTQTLDFNPSDIVFDPNILTIATGIAEHNNYAVDFIRTVRFIKQNLPGARVSGGVSNLSFAFRGNNPVREAMHAVFLHYAIEAGLDMAIVNPEMLSSYNSIPSNLQQAVEAVVLNTHPTATDHLIALAQTLKNAETPTLSKPKQVDAWRQQPVSNRLQYALVNGTTEFVELDVNEALQQYPPLQLIEGVLMEGIGQVGEAFGQGKMFLPQVVKSAQVMQKAVALITPHLPQTAETHRKRVVIATVKGDVHDIGKNILGVVLACNGYEVVDLGVMVDKERIVEAASHPLVCMVCLSGLITPSLTEMTEVAKAMEAAGLKVPLAVGGATTSQQHTALFIDPHYSGVVVHARDASHNVSLLARLLSDTRAARCIKVEYAALREQLRQAPVLRCHAPVNIDWNKQKPYIPRNLQRQEVSATVNELLPWVNWKAYAHDWQLPQTEADALKLEAEAFLQQYHSRFQARAVVQVFPVKVSGDNLLIAQTVLPMYRNGVCLTDFLSPEGDYVGLFAASVHSEKLQASFSGDEQLYNRLTVQLLSNRLVEAFSALLHDRMRKQWWGFPAGIRPAVGYPCLPNHSLKRELFDLLQAHEYTGIQLTENYAMTPLSSVCGFYFAADQAVYY